MRTHTADDEPTTDDQPTPTDDRGRDADARAFARAHHDALLALAAADDDEYAPVARVIGALLHDERPNPKDVTAARRLADAHLDDYDGPDGGLLRCIRPLLWRCAPVSTHDRTAFTRLLADRLTAEPPAVAVATEGGGN